MAARDTAATPLVLWICAAVCAHYVLGQGGNEVAKAHDDSTFFSKMAHQARGKAREADKIFELGAMAENEIAPNEPNAPAPVLPKAPETKKDDPKEKTPDPKAPEEKKEEPKKVVVLPPTVTPPPTPPPPMQPDKRIAVKQHVKPDQEDNPNAKFIGDEANKVDKETVATQTSHDQDDKNPTPGGNHAGPKDREGDSQKTKIADSEDTPGEKNKAPGDKGTEFDVQPAPKPAPKVAMVEPKAQPASGAPGGDGRPMQTPSPAQKPSPDSPGGASSPTPEVAQGAQGWTFDPTRPGGSGAGNQGGMGSSNKPSSSGLKGLALGLGAKAPPGAINLNMNQGTVVAAVGADQLRRERVADGERRKSEHRGSYQASNFEKWRSAIENYVTTVKPGNQTALNTARVPFATYLNTIHNRIHPIFAESFLGSLDGLPSSHPLSNPRLVTHLEIVVGPKDGQIVKMGVVKASGVTAFDVAALDSVKRASPFGPAPSAIVSTDGNVYLHWEFHRDEVFACTTMNARPFLLNLPPAAPPVEPPAGKPPSGPEERERAPGNPNDTRHGAP